MTACKRREITCEYVNSSPENKSSCSHLKIKKNRNQKKKTLMNTLTLLHIHESHLIRLKHPFFLRAVVWCFRGALQTSTCSTVHLSTCVFNVVQHIERIPTHRRWKCYNHTSVCVRQSLFYLFPIWNSALDLSVCRDGLEGLIVCM